ncbi:MAG TPA: hypothetical protein VF546_07315 [Pyrinomonadaceae bacterium]|jgi:hypothetical protein
MGGFLASVGFPYNGLREFARLCTDTRQEGEIITTSAATYYRRAVVVPDTDDYEIELWFEEAHEGEQSALNVHLVGATEGKVGLQAALRQPEGQHYYGAYRCDGAQWIKVGGEVSRLPFVFDCPNFDCGENYTLPHMARVSFCGLGAHLTCYEDEADFLARGKGPPPAFMFASDFVRNGEPTLQPMSPILHLTGWVDETRIMTNPVTDCEFVWATVDVGDIGTFDLVATPDGLHGFLREGGVVSGTVWLSGRLMEW